MSLVLYTSLKPLILQLFMMYNIVLKYVNIHNASSILGALKSWEGNKTSMNLFLLVKLFSISCSSTIIFDIPLKCFVSVKQ